MTGGEGKRPRDETRLEDPEAHDETRLERPGAADETRLEPPSRSDATVPESSAGADATRAEDAPASSGAVGPSSAAGFPEELAARFRPVRELDRGSQAVVWLVKDDAGVQLVAKVFEPGHSAPEDVLEKLKGLEANEDVVPVVDHGHAGGRRYVVLEYVPGGNLNELLTPGSPAPPDLVREVLVQLLGGLERLHGAGIEHQDLKPGNVLTRSWQPLDLVLADFGVSTLTSETVRATRLSGMTWAYAPPEAFLDEPILFRYKFDAWSLGIIVVQLLTGRHPLPQRDAAIAASLAACNTDDLVEGVDDPAWRKLCRGLLRRDADARWGTAEARRWLEAPDAPDLVVKDEAAPAAVRGFRFVGRDYATPADLGDAMSRDWDMAGDVWRNQHPKLVQWLRHELGTTDVAAHMEGIDRDPNMDLDAQLFWAIRTLAPESPPSFRGEPLTTENLARIASQAAAETDGDDARLLMAVSNLPHLEHAGNPALGPQAARWSGATAAYEELSAEHEELPEPSETDRVVLLAAATEGSGVTEQLRARTSEVLVRQERAPQSRWFRRLGDVERAEGPQLLAMALLAATAHEQIMAGVKARRRTQLLAIGAGALAGVVFCLGISQLVRHGPDAVDRVQSFAALPSWLVGVAVAFWLWWRYGRDRLPNPVNLVCGVLAVLLIRALCVSLAYAFAHSVIGSSNILAVYIPGPVLVDMGFVFSACVAIGLGLGAALKRLNLMLTVRTGILATLAVTLVVVVVCRAIDTVRHPGSFDYGIPVDRLPPWHPLHERESAVSGRRARLVRTASRPAHVPRFAGVSRR